MDVCSSADHCKSSSRKDSKAYELYSVGKICAVHEAVSTLNLLIPFQTVSSIRTKCYLVSFLVPSSFQQIFARDPSVEETCLIKDVLTCIWMVSWNRAGWVAGADCLSGDWENVLIFWRSSTSCLCFWSKLVTSSSRSLFWAEEKKYRKLKLSVTNNHAKVGPSVNYTFPLMFNSFYKLALKEVIFSDFYKGILAYWPWVDTWTPKTTKNISRAIVWNGVPIPPQQKSEPLDRLGSPKFLTVSPQCFPNSVWLLCYWLPVTPTSTPTLGIWTFLCLFQGRKVITI